jgi:hypothetical protein
MRGCKIAVSLPVLLQTLGLDNYQDIHLFSAFANKDMGIDDDCFYLCLISETNMELSEIQIVDTFPDAIIECTRIQSKIRML